MQVTINAARVAQAGVGVVAAGAGYAVASSMVGSTFREDLLGSPSEVLEVDGNAVIVQNREGQGGTLTKVFIGAGAASAWGGGALLGLIDESAKGFKGAVRTGGSAGLFALGLGAVAGAGAMAARYAGAEFVPID